MELTPQFISPHERDYRSYHDQLRQYNLSWQRRISAAMIDCLGDGARKGYAFTSTGSDGRLEKGPQSKIEVVVYEDDSGVKDLSAVEGVINEKFGNIFGVPEIKRIGHGSISGFGGNPGNCYPTRVLDSKFLYGNPAFLRDAFKQLTCEFEITTGKRLLDNFSEKVRRAKKVSRGGKDIFKGQEVINFDLDSGVAFYDCENTNLVFRGSFKYGPLRAVQYGLTYELMKKIRNGEINHDFLDHMPQNICERLFFLETEGKTQLAHEELENLADNYKYFLWAYHCSQEAWRTERKNEVPFDPQLVKPKLDSILAVLDLGILK